MKASNYIISYLQKAEVEFVFGYPGTPILPLLEAIRQQDRIKWILCRHENAAALAASAYAKLTGKLGVCLFTSGPGALQGICGVMDAHQDAAPLLVLTGMVSTAQQGHWEFQDVDQSNIYTHVTHTSHSCVNPLQLPSLLRNAIGNCFKKNGASHVALSQDVLQAAINENDTAYNLLLQPIPRPIKLMAPPTQALNIVAGTLQNDYKKIVIAVGKRAKGAGAFIEAIAEKLDAAIITSLDGKGIINESHPNSLGVLGIFGHPGVETAQEIINAADAVLAFGVDTLKPFVTNIDDIQVRDLIECEPDANCLTQDYNIKRFLVGDIIETTSRLNGLLVPKISSHNFNNSNADTSVDTIEGHVHPATFLQALNQHHVQQQIFAVDTGAHAVWVAKYLHLPQGNPMLVSSHLGTMGFCLPALIAAQLACPGYRVVGITGDGGFAMTMAELATAVEHSLPIVLVVFKNGVLQNVQAQQEQCFGTSMHNPDFVALAKAFGADGAAITHEDEIEAVLFEAFSPRDKPFVIELHCHASIAVPLCKWTRKEH